MSADGTAIDAWAVGTPLGKRQHFIRLAPLDVGQRDPLPVSNVNDSVGLTLAALRAHAWGTPA